MAKIHRKQMVAESCYDLALKRLRLTYERFDRVVYAVSGGKDSTACLQLGLQVAREKGRLPLDVFHWDEEAIPPETVEYVERLAAMPDVQLRWFCLPIQHRNACSRKQPFWYPWHPDEREKWVRDLPPRAITNLDGFRLGMGIPECLPLLYPPSCGTVAAVFGIRCQESMTRYGSVASKKGFECYTIGTEWKWLNKVYPIYDWGVEDVWVAPARLGWDYNRAYDVMEKAGVSRQEARCSPLFGEQPIRRLHTYKTCWPSLWAKMSQRVHGAATAARYANTELYGIGVKLDDLPPGMTWEQFTIATMKKLEPEAAASVAKGLEAAIRRHKQCYIRSSLIPGPIPDVEPDKVSGYCWMQFFTMAAAGGDKFGRQTQKIDVRATMTRKKNKLCVSGTQFNDQKKRGLIPPTQPKAKKK